MFVPYMSSTFAYRKKREAIVILPIGQKVITVEISEHSYHKTYPDSKFCESFNSEETALYLHKSRRPSWLEYIAEVINKKVEEGFVLVAYLEGYGALFIEANLKQGVKNVPKRSRRKK